MENLQLIRSLKIPADTKIVLLVADGIGGLPIEEGGPTELEAANTPNLDRLARKGVCGNSIPIRPGITPGSGPGHLGLFGYDPLKYQIGRGVLEAAGIGFAVGPNDVAVRCNFCTIDAQGKITDRRAGRIPTDQSAPLARKLNQVSIPGVEIFVEPVQEHRFVVIFRGEGLGGDVADTDPQKTGVPPLDPVPANEASERTAEVAIQFVEQARALLAGEAKECAASRCDFARRPTCPVYGLKAAAIATRCTRAWRAWSAWRSASRQPERRNRRAGEGLERRLLLRPPEVPCRQPGRRQLRGGQGEDDRAVRRGHSADQATQAECC